MTDLATPPGLFISFEGGDGAGKTTQSRALAEWIVAHTGREVVTTREPGGTELGRTLRQLVLHGEHVDARTEALLYATDRAHHVSSLIRPALDRGAVVLTDRYLDSSLAYQAGGRELSVEDVRWLQMWAVDGLIPDMTFLLDLDHEVFQVDQLAAQLGVDHDASLVPAGFHVVDLDHLIADDGLGPFFFAACGEYEKQTTQEKAFHDCPAIAFH